MIEALFRKALTALLFVSATVGLFAQESDFLTLSGHAKDASSGESLYYASVSLAGTNITNVSNSEGVFSLKVPADTPPEAEVQVSHLGYLTCSIKVSEFLAAGPESRLEIALAPVAISLDPATVKAIDADILFKSAFLKVRDNYSRERVGMTAFYREMIKKGTAKYLVLNEAVLDIDKAPYYTIGIDKVGIYKGRGRMNYDSTDTLFVKLQGGVSTALEIDMVKNPFAGSTLEDATKDYDFTMGELASYDGRSFYVINFDQHPNDDQILFRGKLYIDVETLAIGRVEMSMNVEGREELAANSFVIKKASGTKFYVDKADYVISYRCFDGLWYYDYCRADVSFITRKGRSPFKNRFSVTEEMAVTDHRAGGLAILPANRLKFKDILSDRVSDFIDDDFWEGYNIIEPDESIDVVVKKMVRQLTRHSAE